MNFQWLFNPYSIGFIFGNIIVVTSVFMLYWRNKRKLRKAVYHIEIIKDMLRNIDPVKGLEDNLDRMLEILAYLVIAPTYTFNVLDKKGQQYVLKAVRYQSKEFGEIRPSYSGLASFQQGNYVPSLSIPMNRRVYEIKKVNEGDIPLFYIPVGEKGLITIGPLENLKKEDSLNIQVFVEQMSYMLQGLIISEHNRSQAQVVVTTGKALQKISSVSMDWKTMMEVMIKLLMKSIHASGGFLVRRDQNAYEIAIHVGLDHDSLIQIKNDLELLNNFRKYLAAKDYFIIKRSDDLYYQLPAYLSAAGMATLTLVNLDAGREIFLVLWFEDGKTKPENEISKILLTVMEHVRSVIHLQRGLRQFTNVYLDILKRVVSLIDNMNPYTVGYSELMSRYSVSIARQLHLDDDVIKDIALAAYLSNIGVLGLSSALLDKEGKYSDEEYELMKLHSEVGASIVHVATGNERVASYILHHHERMDGNGYPFGFKGDEIPIGARILAVVQTFLAKINGRNYREPLSFNRAFEQLNASAGDHLDKQIVEIFFSWYKQKRLNPSVSGQPMGICFEILCVPPEICQTCPAYHNRDIPCWEVENNLCRLHGKECKTCIVRTEYVTRNNGK